MKITALTVLAIASALLLAAPGSHAQAPPASPAGTRKPIDMTFMP